jgi:mono/diheme cytochrome c family protein
MNLSAPSRTILVGAALFLAAPADAAGPPPGDPVALRARAVLARHCGGCHGGTGKAKGGMGYILDRDRLVGAGQVVPGKPGSSPLYQRVQAGEMPPAWSKRLSAADRDVLARWIAAGATGWLPAAPARLLAPAEVVGLVRRDLESLPVRQRRFARYLTLTHLAGQPPAVQETLRRAVAKLVNSLSWHPRLTAPVVVDPHRLVLRIDLRAYRWSARQWDRIAATYPYRLGEPGPGEQTLARLTGSEQPVLRADWFVATSSRPPFYHDLLALPSTDRALERQLGVDPADSRENDTAVRAGFNGSGVARFNRVLERHDSLHGAYWHSYDFSDNKGRQNVFEYPLGPEPGPAGFRPAGGEIIFHLPNGLQGYFVVDSAGRRIDRAPGDIVSDPNRPDRIVETGLSCIGCHARGILPKDDQVRAAVLKNRRAFDADVRESVLALYVPAARMRKCVGEDNERFTAALKRLGISPEAAEPVLAVVLRYEEVIDLRRAAAELAVPADRLAALVRGPAERGRTLGPLLAARGTVQRTVFEEAFPGLLKDLTPDGNRGDTEKAISRGPFRGHRGAVRALAWGPGRHTFASGGEDGGVRLWDARTGRSRLLGAHGDEVLAVAFSGDGKRLASGGADRVILVWDIATGRRLARLTGSTDSVRALAVSPDGKVVYSAGADRSIRVWDVAKGRQERAWTAHGGTVTALVLSSDGRLLVSGSVDRTARLWKTPSGQLVSRHEHAAEVRAVAFDRPGTHFLSGGGDGAVALWRVGRDNPVRRLGRHDTAVAGVAVSGDGKTLFSVAARPDPRQESIQAAAVAADGRALLARDGVIHVARAAR